MMGLDSIWMGLDDTVASVGAGLDMRVDVENMDIDAELGKVR